MVDYVSKYLVMLLSNANGWREEQMRMTFAETSAPLHFEQASRTSTIMYYYHGSEPLLI